MRLCDTHFDCLKDALDARGLMDHVPKTENDIQVEWDAQMQALATGDPSAAQENTNPLTGATLGIYVNAVRAGGLYLVELKEDGSEYCPLCELEANCETTAQEWCDCAANEEFEFAKKNGAIRITVN